MADNASITILRNTQANINAEPIKDGNILFTTDQDINVIYADVGTKRIKIGGTVPIDSTITANSVNPVTSKAIYNEFNDVRGQIRTNLLNPTAQTRTINGVTFTNNGDNTITVNGTSTDTAYFAIGSQFTDLDLSKKYKIVGCPKGGSEDTYSLYDDNNNATNVDCGNGAVYTPTNQPKLYIRIRKGTTVNNLLFKPMLTADLSATYDDFVPYTGDSGRLNEDVADLVKGISEISSITNTDIDTILNS